MELIKINNTLTMNSREIAELTGKRHPDVMRDIFKMLEELELDVSNFARIYLDSMNREQTEYVLDKENTLILISGYSVLLRQKIIRRLEELENLSKPKPLTLLESAKELVASLEREEVLRIQLDESKQWLSIKRVAFCNDVKWNSISWRDLKRHGVLNGKEPRKVFDSNFGEVNVYHRDTWNAVYTNFILPKE